MTTRIRLLTTLTLLALAPLALGGCAAAPARPTAVAAARSPVELHVSAAASLRKPFEALAPAFEAANGVKLVFAFGASGVLQKQIEAGAPADVLASASPKQVDALIAEDLISAEETVTFASNDLVILVPKGNPRGVHGPQDLAKADKLVTGNPDTAPHGAKAKEWLTGLGLWKGLQPKFIFAENAAQTLDYVARGEVDAGIGFGSDARSSSAVSVVYTVPKGAIKPIRYVAAPVKATARAAPARKFVGYLSSAEGQVVLKDAGLLPPPGR